MILVPAGSLVILVAVALAVLSVSVASALCSDLGYGGFVSHLGSGGFSINLANQHWPQDCGRYHLYYPSLTSAADTNTTRSQTNTTTATVADDAIVQSISAQNQNRRADQHNHTNNSNMIPNQQFHSNNPVVHLSIIQTTHPLQNIGGYFHTSLSLRLELWLLRRILCWAYFSGTIRTGLCPCSPKVQIKSFWMMQMQKKQRARMLFGRLGMHLSVSWKMPLSLPPWKQ